MPNWKSILTELGRRVRTPLAGNGISFLVGTLFGLVILGWIVWPVQYVDTTPQTLRSDIQLDYLRMTVDSYAVNGDATLARSRFDALGSKQWDLLDQLHNDKLIDPGRLQQFEVLIANLYVGTPGNPGSVATPASGSGGLQGILSVLAIVGIIIGAAIAIVLIVNIRRRKGLSPAEESENPESSGELSIEAEEELTETSAPEAASVEEEGIGAEPLERFVSTYVLGDDLYEDSFTINSASGEFLGECGVGISEPIGVGTPKKVTAFEVWLFDRKPSRTSTTVLLSEYANQKEDLRASLAPRGTAALAMPGADIWMETPGLQLRVVIREIIYGEGSLPHNSYFERLTLQLEIWAKTK
jgi:uncharacterized membrane protein YciS (DUF1049 family)